MTSVVVDLGDVLSDEDIRRNISEYAKKIKELRSEIKIWEKAIDIVVEKCVHSKTESGNTWGRWSYTKCLICGKEW